MNKIIGVTIAVVFLLLAVILSVCMACDKGCVCPVPVIKCGAYDLPGLWQVQIGNRTVCGEVTIIGGSTALINDEILLLNKAKKMKRVEVCE